ncbi:MAG TPA: bifunctional methylenetetrahydrofolate dehydrogenase/methenyltetrahydrofolate cyclohydrolase FolD [Gammaproteobacteria bacterium]|nr:bifunctional methylenetetrahydrofolate dehydrogenase/methenyltetrahydrofolate cyclohydrolase FolD [Gammaproteobacteria bacterium]|tara:strand:- start:179 stop:1057 length:879 start_codon:yes stop_codon:yes gene_type:complete
MDSKAIVIDGSAMAERLRNEVAHRVEAFRSATSIDPSLAVVMVGDDAASQVYVRNKMKQTAVVGIRSVEKRLPRQASESEVLEIIQELNEDSSIHGILVQLPLPEHIDPSVVVDAIDPNKDVDGLHRNNVAALVLGEEGLVPCTPTGCLLMLRQYAENLSGMRAVILGRSRLVGKPLAELLLRENCTVTMAHSKTAELPTLCRSADILVAAIGRPNFVQGEWIKPGAIVIDVGMNRIKDNDGKRRLVGDVDYQAALSVAQAVSPVPGGVGPMTVVCLLRNTIQAAERQLGQA